MKWPAKDIEEVLDYSIEWAARLGSTENIDSATFEVLSGAVEIDSSTVIGTAAVAWLSGGTPGIAHVGCEIVTDAGRTFREVVTLPIVDRTT